MKRKPNIGSLEVEMKKIKASKNNKSKVVLIIVIFIILLIIAAAIAVLYVYYNDFLMQILSKLSGYIDLLNQ